MIQKTPYSLSIFLLLSMIAAFLLTPSYPLAMDNNEADENKRIERWWGKTIKQEQQARQTVLEYAMRDLQSNNQELKEKAFYKIEILGEYAVPSLIKIINGKDKIANKRIQMDAIYAAGRLGDKSHQAVPAITRNLRSKDPDKRAISAIALGKIGKKADSSVKVLKILLHDNDPWVRESAVNALQQINTHAARKALQHYN